MMNIGYACRALAVPGSEIKGCMAKNASEERILQLIGQNLAAFKKMVEYNIENGIRLFRISSDIIPFGSSLAANIPWEKLYADRLLEISRLITGAGMRVSMHPGQYTVLNSPSVSVVERAVQDLQYHTKVLDCLGLGSEHKLVLHMGGAYGNKQQAMRRFLAGCHELDPSVKRRLVLENDGALFTIADVLETAAAAGLPVVYDNLHNAVNPADKTCPDACWIAQCSATWGKNDGMQKIHYSQQNREKRLGAHSKSIRIDEFLAFCGQIGSSAIDVMLEVKDKNVSACKCLNCTSDRGIGMLETEWARYKYVILEHSPETYQEIRQLLKNKTVYPAYQMYRLIEDALALPVTTGHAVNASQHVFGYFKNIASENEKRRYQMLLQKASAGETDFGAVKKQLLRLAENYKETYLLTGYYFYD